MSISKALLIKKASEGYTVCYVDACPLRTQCLRWLAGPYVPHDHSTYRCVNPHFEGVASAECPLYRNDQKVRFAKGMLHTFTDDMPKRLNLRSAMVSSVKPTVPTTLSTAMVRD